MKSVPTQGEQINIDKIRSNYICDQMCE
jgi:hypothetical protein